MVETPPVTSPFSLLRFLDLVDRCLFVVVDTIDDECVDNNESKGVSDGVWR